MLAYWLIALSGPLFAIMPYLACMHGLHISAGFNSLLTHFCGMIIHITAQHTCREWMSCVRDMDSVSFGKLCTMEWVSFGKTLDIAVAVWRGLSEFGKKWLATMVKLMVNLGMTALTQFKKIVDWVSFEKCLHNCNCTQSIHTIKLNSRTITQ